MHWHNEAMTYTPPFPTAADDVIDSRDVIWHISDLSTDLENAETTDDLEQIESDLAPLLALADEGETLPDWEDGVQLIRDDYFETFAQEFANDIGAIDEDATAGAWPLYCIDWERAARELQMDYTPVEFDGVTYWAR
jgi:hypothetical protein